MHIVAETDSCQHSKKHVTKPRFWIFLLRTDNQGMVYSLKYSLGFTLLNKTQLIW